MHRADGTPWLEIELPTGDGRRVLRATRNGEGRIELVDEQNAVVASAKPAPAPHGPLTAREVEILSLLARGRTNHEVAQALGISVRTAEAHRARIARKLGRSSRAALVEWALAHGLVGL